MAKKIVVLAMMVVTLVGTMATSALAWERGPGVDLTSSSRYVR